MKSVRSDSGLLNLDVLALSLLCCLLASVVGVLVIGGDAAIAARWNELEQQAAKFKSSTSDAENLRREIEDKVVFAQLDRDNRLLRSQVGELRSKADLQKAIADAKAEIEESKKRIAENQQKESSPERRRMLGDYSGSYVLLDCFNDSAIIYPNKQKIEISPSNADQNRLLKKIQDAGFVVFIARPSSWSGDAYDKIKTWVCSALDQSEKQGGSPVGRSTLPLDESESIENYLPPDKSP